MRLSIPDSKEQAILALVARLAGKYLSTNQGYLGRSAVQKIMYFLQACGVPLRYRFNVHHYGPFCSGILSDIDWLIATSVIVDTSQNERYSNYRAGQNADEIIGKYETDIQPYEALIRSVVEALVPMEPERLELIATLHYAYRELKAAGNSVSRDSVLARFRDYKGDKFDQSTLEETFERMATAKLFEQGT